MSGTDNGSGEGQGGTLVALGRIGAAWGVRGWVRLHSFTDPPGNLLEYRHFRVRGAGTGSEAPETIELDEVKPHGKSFVGHIVGCDDREATRRYTGLELLVEQARLPSLDAGTWYWHQLIGLEVWNHRDEHLGRVENMMETGAHDVLVVKDAEGRERLIPFVRDAVVREVDPTAGRIRVDWESDY